jgi:NLI interacting factor-like phosphatase
VSIQSFGNFLSFAREIKKLKLSQPATVLIEELKDLCFQKFPLLVTVDLCGTLVLRVSRDEFPHPGDISVKHKTYFLRPGHKEFLLRLKKHPRIKLAFYTSVMEKNITPVLDSMLTQDLSIISKGLKVYDQKYCRRMYDHPSYKQLQKKIDEHYRDLKLVWSDKFCKINKFDRTNTIHIDSESTKV